MNQFDPRYMQLLISKLEKITQNTQSVVSVAKELSVSRQTVHKYLLRYRRFGEDGIRYIQTKRRTNPAHNRTSEELERLVIQLSRQFISDRVEILADRLQYENNITLHPATIYRILKRNNIRYTNHYLATKKRWKNNFLVIKYQGKSYKWILNILLVISK